MTRLKIATTVLFVVALAAIGATAAQAEEALWLISGTVVASSTSVEVLIELLLEDTKAPLLGEVAIHECDGAFIGTISAGGEGEITELLTISGTAVPARKLSGANVPEGLLCKSEDMCENLEAETQAWPSKLPISTLLELMANQQQLVTFGPSGWTTLCLIAGTNVEDECNGETNALVEDMAGESALGLFNAESSPGNCQLGGVGDGLVEGNSIVLTLTGLEVTVDSP